MATTTANTILKSSESEVGEFIKLLDIIGYPDLGSAPSKLDTTDLSATKFKTGIFGLQETPDLTFEANYDIGVYTTISNMKTERFFNLEFGEDGVNGIYAWKGEVAVFVTGGGVDEVRKMTVVLSASTPIELIS